MYIVHAANIRGGYAQLKRSDTKMERGLWRNVTLL